MEGNLCDMASLNTFFAIPEGFESIVIHCASMVTTNAEFNQKLIDINVGGTKRSGWSRKGTLKSKYLNQKGGSIDMKDNITVELENGKKQEYFGGKEFVEAVTQAGFKEELRCLLQKGGICKFDEEGLA